jgi:nucleotide-binding universal stress UspA family protein
MSHTALRKSAPEAKPATGKEAFQDLLVYQDDSATAQNAMAYADALATAAEGNLSALMFGFMATYPTTIYMEAAPDVWLAAQRKAEEEATVIEGRIRGRLKPLHSSPELRRVNVMGGEAGEILAGQARYADATILGLDDGGPSHFQRQLFEGALFYSGRPVIIVPAGYKKHALPKKIMIAWRPGREATRALHDALPLLKVAAEVRLIAVDEHMTTHHEPEPGMDIARHLARHDIQADVKHIPGSGGTTARLLLDEARYFGADLIVMGGYGHSRLREWILGGVTRDVLATAGLPVLMSQ